MSSVLSCPCGLTQEQLVACTLVGPTGRCTAEDADGKPCGQRLADHPHQQQGTIHALFYFFHLLT